MARTHMGTAGAIALMVAALMSTSALAGQVRSGSGATVTSGSGLPVFNRARLCDPLALQAGTCLESRVDRIASSTDGGAAGPGDSGGGGDNGESGGGDNGEGGGEGGGTDNGDSGEGGDGPDGGDGQDGGDGGDPNQR